MTLLDIIRFIVGLIVLGYASYSDMKTRMVCDKAWIAIASAGFIILFIQLFMENVSWLYYLTFLPIGALFTSFFVEGSDKTNFQEGKINRFFLYPVYVCGIIVTVYLVYIFSLSKTDILFLTLMEIPLVMLLIYLLYYFRLIFGGADAKALIALSVLFPFYPSVSALLGYFPLKIIWPYTLVILTNGAITALVIPISYLFYNLITDPRNIRFPVCFLGYREDIHKVKNRYLWPLEIVDNGKKRFVLFQKRDANINEQIDALLAYGAKKIWVTHKIPFMIPLFMGFVTAFLVGDILNYLVNSVILQCL